MRTSKLNGKVLLRLSIVGVALMLGLVLLLGAPKTARAESIEVDVSDAMSGTQVILTVAGDITNRKIESCGIMYVPEWKDLEDGRRVATFNVVGHCDSLTLTGEKIYFDNSEFWDVIDGWIRKVPLTDPLPTPPTQYEQLFVPTLFR